MLVTVVAGVEEAVVVKVEVGVDVWVFEMVVVSVEVGVVIEHWRKVPSRYLRYKSERFMCWLND